MSGSDEPNGNETTTKMKEIIDKIADLDKKFAVADALKGVESRVAELEPYPKAVKYAASVIAIFATVFLAVITVFGYRLTTQVDNAFRALGEAQGTAALMQERLKQAASDLTETKSFVSRALEARAVAEQSVQSIKEINKQQVEAYNNNLREMRNLLGTANPSARELAELMRGMQLPPDVVRANQLSSIVERISSLESGIRVASSNLSATTEIIIVRRPGNCPVGYTFLGAILVGIDRNYAQKWNEYFEVAAYSTTQMRLSPTVPDGWIVAHPLLCARTQPR